MTKQNKISLFKTSIINKITSLISAHNSDTFAHSDIRAIIPTKTSQLTNNSGFLTTHQDISGKLDKAQGSANASKNVVTDGSGNITTEAKITKTSQLTNDSGFLTSHQNISGKLNIAQGSANASKNVVTDSSGNITTEAKPTIPTKTSQLTNDSNYTTATGHNHDGTYIKTGTGTVTSTNIANGAVTNDKVTSITKSKISDFPAIVNNVSSNSTTDVLSAKQGKELNNKITTLNNRYNGVYCANSGTNTSKPFYRLFNITSVNTSGQSSKFIFEITSATSTQYAKFAVYLRRNTTTTGYMIVDVIDSTNFDLSNIFFAYRSIYLDVFYKVDSMNYYRVKIVDDHLREGTLTQFSPTEGNVEAYASVESAGTALYGANYGSIVDGNTNYNILASKIQKIGGTSSQFLKADGSVDTVVDNLTTDSSTRALSAKQGKWLYDNKLQYANKIEYITSTHTSATNAWTGTSTTISSLYKGLVIFYRLNQAPQGSTVGNVTLNLTLKDGTTTGAKGVYFQASRLTDEYLQSSVIVMVWDGSNWNIINTTSAVNNLTTTSSTRALSATQGKWLYDNKASSTHTHGNITNAGAIGSTANLPIITTTDGKLTTGSFGTAANTFCQGNDSRLSDARTPTSHTHGDITNDGKIGTASGKPIITTTSGKLTTGSFGTTSGTFCQGNDSRLSDARTPTSHTHGSISNTGTIELITSTQTSATNAWTGTSTTISSLVKGTRIYYYLKKAPTTSGVTLNLTLSGGGTTGAKQVLWNGVQLTNQIAHWNIIELMYDGSNWFVVNSAQKSYRIGFQNGGTTPATSLEFSVNSGNLLYAIIRDENRNIPANITKGYMVVNGSFQPKTVNATNGTIYAQMNVKATFLVEAGFYDENGWVVASATCKVTVT